MKRIIIPLEDEVYRQVKAKAKELNTSVSGLVENYLIQFVADKQDSDRPKQSPDSTKARKRP